VIQLTPDATSGDGRDEETSRRRRKDFSTPSMKAEIQKLIDEFRTQGWKSNPYELTQRLIDGQSEHVVTLVEMVLEQLPKSGTFFTDAISFVPELELPRLAGLAIAKLKQSGTSEDFITHCSLQRVEALHPFLTEIYELKPNWRSYYSDWPWRKSGALHFEFLKQVVENSSDPEASQKAWRILLETRHSPILEYCAQHSDFVGDSAARSDFLEVGFELGSRRFRQLYGDEVHHLVFPEAYWRKEKTPPHLAKRHPTWNCSEGRVTSPSRFGGLGAHTCGACGKQGHHLLSLTEIPNQLAITGLRQARFETCLSCLGWEVPQMFYRHDGSGDVITIAYEGPRIVPKFPSEPFIETEIRFTETPQRWQWQDWAVTNSRQNLHRLGGHPCWIQSADYQRCPLCHDTMSFLFQLDSDLLVGSSGSKPTGEFLWGSGGICYAHWCDRCKVSGYSWQCT